MKKLITLSVAILSLALVSCGEAGTRTMSPKQFNDTAINTFKAANTTLEQFDSKLTEAVKSSNLSSIKTEAETALSTIDGKIQTMEGINAPEAGGDYKEAVIEALKGVKEILETGKKYGELGENYAKSEFNALEKEYNAKRKELSGQLQNVAKAQTAFAKSVAAK